MFPYLKATFPNQVEQFEHDSYIRQIDVKSKQSIQMVTMNSKLMKDCMLLYKVRTTLKNCTAVSCEILNRKELVLLYNFCYTFSKIKENDTVNMLYDEPILSMYYEEYPHPGHFH